MKPRKREIVKGVISVCETANRRTYSLELNPETLFEGLPEENMTRDWIHMDLVVSYQARDRGYPYLAGSCYRNRHFIELDNEMIQRVWDILMVRFARTFPLLDDELILHDYYLLNPAKYKAYNVSNTLV